MAENLVDGAAVDSLIWDFLSANEPGLKERVKVIARFGPYGIPPVVAGPHIDSETRARLQKVLTKMHEDSRGRQILRGMRIERFIPVTDAVYESVRQLQHRLQKAEERQ